MNSMNRGCWSGQIAVLGRKKKRTRKTKKSERTVSGQDKLLGYETGKSTKRPLS